MQTSLREEAERLLHNLQGVVAVSVEGTLSDIEYVHVLALSQRSQTQILRDVRSALMAQLGVNVAPSGINVLMMTDESLHGIRPTRPELLAVELARTESKLEARVTLSQRGTTVEGVVQASVLATPLHVVAEATIEAVHSALLQRSVFHVDHVQLTPMVDSQIVLAAVQLKTGRMVRQLLGASYVIESPYEACAKAVLDAVNRQFMFTGMRR